MSPSSSGSERPYLPVGRKGIKFSHVHPTLLSPRLTHRWGRKPETWSVYRKKQKQEVGVTRVACPAASKFFPLLYNRQPFRMKTHLWLVNLWWFKYNGLSYLKVSSCKCYNSEEGWPEPNVIHLALFHLLFLTRKLTKSNKASENNNKFHQIQQSIN